MKHLIFILSLFGILSGCSQSGTSEGIPTEDNSKTVDLNDSSLEVEAIDVVSFFKYNKKCLLRPGKCKVYNWKLYETGELNVGEISEAFILEKSETKHPQRSSDNTCDWANYLRIVYENDTLIVFGKDILEVTQEDMNILFSSDTISVIIASDFTTGASDENGLTGCDDFSYLILKSNQNGYEFVYPQNLKEGETGVVAVLLHDEGADEMIDETYISGDTIKLKIEVGYQDGGGSYTLNILRKSRWTYFITDRQRTNNYE